MDHPLLGGTTDIDMFFIHNEEIPTQREIVRVSDDIHLDIAHLPASAFNHPRSLRLDPWLGSYLCEQSIVLHDIQHWFEFTQASVCAQFNQPENQYQRSLPLAENARQAWLQMSGQARPFGPAALKDYLDCVENAANAIALLSGPPLVQRRFLLQFGSRTAAIQQPGLETELVGLITSGEIDSQTWSQWLDEWDQALKQAAGQAGCPPSLHAARRNYYYKAVESLYEEHPEAAIWILLRTWTRALGCLPADIAPLAGWQAACQALSLDENSFSRRLQELDSFLDHVEETLDIWAYQTGVKTSSNL
jgi:hypothetical protein